MKRFAMRGFALLLCALLLLTTASAAGTEYILDNSALLTADEAAQLNEQARSVSEREGCSVTILTVDSLGGKDAGTYAEDYYDQKGLGYGNTEDGILLVVSMSQRDYAITGAGIGNDALSGSRMGRLEDSFLGKLSAGNYYGAFSSFISMCGTLIDEAKTYGPESGWGGTRSADPGKTALGVVLALVLGFLISLIPLSVMKSKHSNLGKKAEATNYARQGSLNITRKQDLYLRTSTNRVRIQTDNGMRGGGGGGSHISSSGVSHTTSSGKF